MKSFRDTVYVANCSTQVKGWIDRAHIAYIQAYGQADIGIKIVEWESALNLDLKSFLGLKKVKLKRAIKEAASRFFISKKCD